MHSHIIFSDYYKAASGRIFKFIQKLSTGNLSSRPETTSCKFVFSQHDDSSKQKTKKTNVFELCCQCCGRHGVVVHLEINVCPWDEQATLTRIIVGDSRYNIYRIHDLGSGTSCVEIYHPPIKPLAGDFRRYWIALLPPRRFIEVYDQTL